MMINLHTIFTTCSWKKY